MNILKLTFRAMAIMGPFVTMWMPLSVQAQPPFHEALENFQTTQNVISNRLRRAIVSGNTITAPPGEPTADIFHCGGDIEESDGTCNDVIVACATLDLEFECNKEDEEGVCTNGGC